MLNLTPFEETTLGKQIYGRGVSLGISRGVLIGNIRYAQKILRLPIITEVELTFMSQEDLLQLQRQLDNEVEALLKTMAHA